MQEAAAKKAGGCANERRGKGPAAEARLIEIRFDKQAVVVEQANRSNIVGKAVFHWS